MKIKRLDHIVDMLNKIKSDIRLPNNFSRAMTEYSLDKIIEEIAITKENQFEIRWNTMEKTDKEIMAKYDFIHPEKPITESLMTYGFECDKGWYDIIDETFEKLSRVRLPDGFEVVQVKQKNGLLRIEVSVLTEEILKILSDVEGLSAKTCEVCSKEGVCMVTLDNMVKTICRNCIENRNRQ